MKKREIKELKKSENKNVIIKRPLKKLYSMSNRQLITSWHIVLPRVSSFPPLFLFIFFFLSLSSSLISRSSAIVLSYNGTFRASLHIIGVISRPPRFVRLCTHYLKTHCFKCHSTFQCTSTTNANTTKHS